MNSSKKLTKQALLLATGFFSGGGLCLFSIYALGYFISSFDFSGISSLKLISGALLGIVTVWMVRKFLYYFSLIKTIAFVFFSQILLFLVGELLLYNKVFSEFSEITYVFYPSFFLSFSMIMYLIVTKYGDYLQGRLLGLNFLTGIFFGMFIYAYIGISFVSGADFEKWFIIVSFASFLLAFVLIYFIGFQYSNFNEMVFSSLMVKSDKLTEISQERDLLNLLKRRSFYTSLIVVGLILYLTSVVNSWYSSAKPLITHLSIIVLIASGLAMIVYALWIRNLQRIYKIILMLASSGIVLLYFIVSLFVPSFDEIFAFVNMYAPPFIILLLYLSLMLVIMLRLGYEEFVFSNYYNIKDIHLRLYNTISLNWKAEANAILLISLFIAFINIFFEPYQARILISFIAFIAVLKILVTLRIMKKIKGSLLWALEEKESEKEKKRYAFKIAKALEDSAKKQHQSHTYRLLNFLRYVNPVYFREKVVEYLKYNSNLLQELAIIEVRNGSCIEALKLIKDIIDSKYFVSMSNSELIKESYEYLKDIDERLISSNYGYHLSISKFDNERKLGAVLCKYLKEEEKNTVLQRLLFDNNEEVVEQALISAVGTQVSAFQKAQIKYLNNDRLKLTAFASVVESGSIIVPELEKAYHFVGQSYEVQKMIIRAYEKIHSENANKYLFDKLNSINRQLIEDTFLVLSNVEANVPERMHYIIENEIEETAKQLVWALHARKRLGKSKLNIESMVIDALDNQIIESEERIFTLLSLLYDSRSINKIRRSRFSKDTEVLAYAAELLDKTLPEELATRTWLMILLINRDVDSRVKKIQPYLPFEEDNEKRILEVLIVEEPKAADSWTKACAIQAYKTFVEQEEDYDFLVAGVNNPGYIVKETAINTIKELNINLHDKLLNRYDVANLSNKDLLQIEITSFLLNETPVFANLTGFWARKIAEITITRSVKFLKCPFIDFIQKNHYCIVYQGEIIIKRGNRQTAKIKRGDELIYLDYHGRTMEHYNIDISKPALLLVLDKVKFDLLLSELNPISDCLIQNKKRDSSTIF